MHQFPLIKVAGTPREMGRQHGEQAAALITRYLASIEKSTGKDRDELGARARAFEPFIDTLNPLLLDEIRGLAEGAAIPYEHALLCQARGEAVKAPLEGCTAFALTGMATAAGQPLAGQNQDLPPEFADLGIVLHLRPDDGRPRAITFTFAGQLGYMGMNHLGDTVTFNGRVSGKHVDGDNYLVELDVWAESENQGITTPCKATVILPQRRETS